jgi:hypothetical protein
MMYHIIRNEMQLINRATKMKKQDIKTNELEVKNYSKVIGYVGRTAKPMIDYVTEYVYISEKSLTIGEFEIILEGKGAYGQLQFIKKVLNFANGEKLYKHICKAIMY